MFALLPGATPGRFVEKHFGLNHIESQSMSKSWDDVYPADYPVESLLPKAHGRPSVNSDECATPARHWRSKSAPDEDAPSSSWDTPPRAFQQVKEGWNHMQKSSDGKMKDTKNSKFENYAALEQEIANLRMQLQNERQIRWVLEQALGRASSVVFPVDKSLPSQQTKKKIKEIALLELEVAHLEQHLLSLYRKTFERCLNESNVNEHHLEKFQADKLPQCTLSRVANQNVAARFSCQIEPYASRVPGDYNVVTCPEMKTNQSVNNWSRHMKTQDNPESCIRNPSGSMHFGAFCLNSPKVQESEHRFVGGSLSDNPIQLQRGISCHWANRLSEELVCCMAAIYCKLADPPIPLLGGLNSPLSCSSTSTSTRDISSDAWSPKCQTEYDVTSNDSTEMKDATENITYSSMVEVQWICVDNDRLTYAARMLRNFRSLVQQLEKVNPGRMKCEEKLAFWINIYNALMMHAYLAYGIPRNHIKRVSLLQKAAYKIGSLSINAYIIEQSILGCRLHRPVQWLQTLLSPGIKLRGDERQAYALDTPEPLVYFALCCGGQSDPVVRVYTAENIYGELRVAKQQYLHMNVNIQKDNKVLLPRMLESFAKESCFTTSDLLEWLCQNVPVKRQNAIRKCIQGKQKCIEWDPYNFTFRYVFVRDLAQWFPPTAVS